MKNELATTNNKMQIGKLNEEQIALIKNTVARGATDDELKLFIAVANNTGLDPFTHQIHFVKRRTWNKEKRNYEEVGSIQTGIDGYRSIASRTKEHAGTDDAIFEEKDGMPIKASVTVYRMIGGDRRAFSATARFSEYAQKFEKDNKESLMGMWAKMPFSQLAKCAEALALRKAFPAEISNVRSDEEMQQADTIIAEPKRSKAKVVEVKVEELVEEKPNTNSLKNRIVLLMKANGLQPNDNTPEGWADAVQKNIGMELIEANYEKIIEVLQNTVQPPQE